MSFRMTVEHGRGSVGVERDDLIISVEKPNQLIFI